jgi:lysozyme|tara:strand:+ start:138 stop:593 length:456 start_codon:yes stop_codon:yes gene_type:complete
MIDMEKLLASVKKHEGYRNKVYLDTLNKRTVGVGHLCVEDFWEDDKEYEEKFLMDILEADLQNAIKSAKDLINNCPSGGKANISSDAEIIIIEMVFQLGKSGVSKFRNMWKALQQDPPQYDVASIEMLDSRWAKQTPNRAKAMADQMKSCV